MAARSITALLTLSSLLASVSAHAFFHTGFVNGISQGHLFGVRAPQSNSPIQDVNSNAITCNSPLHQPVSKDVIEVKPGDTFGMQWNHNIAGPTPGDSDDPIAASHKGPVMAYMARVDDAASNTGAGLKWFKVAEEGLDTTTGKWGVDTLIANKGRWSFTVPTLAPGEYLLRGELIALHSAGSTGEAQFYMSCVGIRVTGSGTCSPSDTVSFPGAYRASDPGILTSIYSGTGKLDNAGKPYVIPGPPVVSCASAPSNSKPVGSPNPTSSRPGGSENSSKTRSETIIVTASPTTKGNVLSTTTTTSISSSKSTGVSYTQPFPSPTTSKPVSPTTFSTRTRPNTATSTTAEVHKSSPLPSVTSTSTSTSTTSTALPFHPWQGWYYPSPPDRANSDSENHEANPPPGPEAPNADTGSDDSDGGSGDYSPAPAQGYQFKGPGGKKFVCYEVED